MRNIFNNLKFVLAGLAIATVAVAGIWLQIHIHNQCGWERSMFWGKSVNALYFLGYCND